MDDFLSSIKGVLHTDNSALSPAGLGQGGLDGLDEVQGGLASGDSRVEDGRRENVVHLTLRTAPKRIGAVSSAQAYLWHIKLTS